MGRTSYFLGQKGAQPQCNINRPECLNPACLATDKCKSLTDHNTKYSTAAAQAAEIGSNLQSD